VPGDNTVIVVDVASLSVISTIPIGSAPQGLSVSVDGSKLWVANSGSTNSAIGVVDLNTLQVLPSLAAPKQPFDIEEGAGHRLYVTPYLETFPTNGIMQIDGNTGAFLSSLGSVSTGSLLEVSQDRGLLFVGSGGALIKYNIAIPGPSIVQQANELGSNPQGLRLSHGGQRIVFPHGSGNGAGYSTFEIPTANLTSINGTFDTDAYPGPVAFSNDDTLLYHVVYGSNTIKLFSTETYAPLQTIQFTGNAEPQDLAIDRSGRWLFVAMADFQGNGDLRVFDTGRNDLLPAPSPTPTGPPFSPTPTAPPVSPTPPTTPTPTPTPTPAPFAEGKIAFVSGPFDFPDIYVMDPNGLNRTRLTFNGSEDTDPAWSRDGTKIAFTSLRDGNYEIYTMNADGSDQTRLTNDPARDFSPTWSPDGTKIAFSSYRNAGAEIYVMGADGSNPTRLTNNSTTEGDLAWSPDGTKIAFYSTRQSASHIYTVDANGSNEIRLTDTGNNFYPAWSPDGTRIAFHSNRSGNYEIYVMEANGANPINLTNHSAGDYEPSWSPDGTAISFFSNRTAGGEIYVMHANGSNQTVITSNSSITDIYADWGRPPVPTPTPTLTPTPTPTPTATPTPSATPAAQTVNLSTRMRVQTGDNVGIGGFIISGTASKHVLVRAIGPSLTQFGVPHALPDPVLELHGPGTFVTITNNNWRDDPAQEALIQATGLAPSNNLESAIDANLDPGAYTAVVRGNNNSAGVALIEVFDLNQTVPSKLANISTRAFVSTGDDIVIAGFILGNNSGNDRIVVRGIGPSLTPFGVPDALTDPTLELHDSNGAVVVANNDWQDDPGQAAELNAAGLAPSNPVESGIAATLPPGAYTALLAGRNNGPGNGVVEVYDRGAP
jgi:YVTN family beta-propeller protein